MAHSILLVFERPDTGRPVEDERQWEGCAMNMGNIARQSRDIEILGENVLLLSLQTDLKGVVDVVSNSLGLKYRYAIFDQEIEWHKTAI